MLNNRECKEQFFLLNMRTVPVYVEIRVAKSTPPTKSPSEDLASSSYSDTVELGSRNQHDR